MDCSSASWALGSGLVSELTIVHPSVSVFVEFLDDLVYFFLSNEVASGLNHSLELIGAESATVVEVQGVESLIGIEPWPGCKALSQGFSGTLASHVSSPHLGKLSGCVG